jgi:hypothetical protein
MIAERFEHAIRPLAKRLHADHMCRLGIRNTMRIAKTYSHLKFGKYQRYREQQYREKFDALLDENGLKRLPDIEMNNGWALDTSGTLPHLSQMLDEADEVIREHGLVRRKAAGSYRSFFQNIIEPGDLEKYPSFLNFALCSEVLSVVCKYQRCIPALSGTLPPGVRFAESSAQFDDQPKGTYRDSQLWHIDYYSQPIVYVIVLLRDVTVENGPFCWMSIEPSQRAARALNYWAKGVPYRVPDDMFYSAARKEDVHVLTYPKGTVLFIDPSQCFHFGSRDAVKPRYMMMYGYPTAYRTDLSELIMKPIQYRIRENDSRLRKMLLNKTFLD